MMTTELAVKSINPSYDTSWTNFRLVVRMHWQPRKATQSRYRLSPSRVRAAPLRPHDNALAARAASASVAASCIGRAPRYRFVPVRITRSDIAATV